MLKFAFGLTLGSILGFVGCFVSFIIASVVIEENPTLAKKIHDA